MLQAKNAQCAGWWTEQVAQMRSVAAQLWLDHKADQRLSKKEQMETGRW